MLLIKRGLNILAAASLVLATACSGAQSNQSLNAGSTETVVGNATPPPKSAEQIIERLLALLQRTETPADLSLPNVQRHMGLRMTPTAGDGSQFEATGRLGGAWTYALATVRSSGQVAPHALRLRLDDGRDGTSDMSAVCRFNYEQYKSSLERIGFEPRVISGSRRQVNFNHDSGSGLYVIVYVRRESAANSQETCVDMVLVDFMPGSPKTTQHP